MGMRLQLIPPGRFLMGAPQGDQDASEDEKPQHEVTLSKPFQIGMTEVTIGEFRKFVDATGYKTEAESDQLGAYQVKPHERESALVWSRFEDDEVDEELFPVTRVSWTDAGKFLCVAWQAGWMHIPLTERSRMGIRLPGRKSDSLFIRK